LEKVFDMYAKYYDLLYRDKNYLEEAEYVQKFINRFNAGAKNILDLGCGTGKHDFIFAGKGFDVTGIELSEKMIETANENLDLKKELYKTLRFFQGDVRNIRLDKKFDVIVSLFHVMSYQKTNEDLLRTIKTVKDHLKSDGIFLFDFWYGPAVLSERPEARIKKLEDEEIMVERYAEPSLHINENIVDVNYRVCVKEKLNNIVNEIRETHSMRYLFIPELKFFLDVGGMEIITYEAWITGKAPDNKSWSVFAAARNKN